MKAEKMIILGADRLPVSVTFWLPQGPCKGVMQVVHGMTEHIGRYADFAEKMAEAGILTAGFDLKGHGRNPGDQKTASLGEDGWTLTLQNMELLNGKLTELYPDIPLFMLGFSLGSFLVRDYLSQKSEGVSAAVIMGTGYQPASVLKLLKGVVRGQIKKAGFDQTTPLVQKLSFETYNKKFAPCRTPSDWLCSDPAELDAYRSDPLCRENISAGLFWQLLDGMERTGERISCSRWKKDLPILLLSGQDDPVGNFGKGVQTVAKRFRKTGLQQTELQLIPHARHDLLHEKENGGAAAGIEYILHFLSKVMD